MLWSCGLRPSETYSWRPGMNISKNEIEPLVVDVLVSENALEVVFEDGRELKAPLVWFPRLANASPKERSNWRLIGRGEGIHWPDVDEDISAVGLLAARVRTGPARAA